MASLAPSIPYQQEKDEARSDSPSFGILDPQWIEVFSMLGLIVLYVFAMSYGGNTLDVINVVGPILFSASLITACYRMVIKSSFTLWAPLLWYRVAVVTYFGIGSTVPAFVNDSTRDLLANFYSYFPNDLAKLSLVVTVFHVIVIGVAKISFVAINDTRQSSNHGVGEMGFIHPSNFSMGVFGAVFLAVGMIVNLFMTLPASLGIYTVPGYGSLANLSLGSLLGYFFLTVWSLENKSNWLYGTMAFALLESLMGIILMTKFVTLFPIVMVGIGFVFHKTNKFRLVAFAATMIFLFTTLAPIVGYARNTLQKYYSGSATIAQTYEIYASYFNRTDSLDAYGDVQDGWMRLSYATAGTFAINQYDRDLPGNSYRYITVVLIPRILYPSKPNITDVSREFTQAVNGNYDSSSSAGIPAESYWNLGWWGPILVGIFLGVILTYWSIYSYMVFYRDAWHLFFVVLFGMRTASRMDGALVADIVGPVGIAIIAHIILELLNRFLPRRKVAA